MSISDSNLESEYQNLPINLSAREVKSHFACESMNIAIPGFNDVTQPSASTFFQPFQRSRKVSQYYYPCMADGKA